MGAGFFAAALARVLALIFGAAAFGATFGAAFGVESVFLDARALWARLLREALLLQSPLWLLALLLLLQLLLQLLLSLQAQQSLLLPLLLGPILVGRLILRISPFYFRIYYLAYGGKSKKQSETYKAPAQINGLVVARPKIEVDCLQS